MQSDSQVNDVSDSNQVNDVLLMDAIDYIDPNLQNFILPDMNSSKFRDIACNMALDMDKEFNYLGEASFPGSLPAHGYIYTLNKRLVVNLVCKIERNPVARNIIFMVNTGSPVTYLSEEAIFALAGRDRQALDVKIHSDRVIQARLSPKDSQFAEANVLGMDFFAKNNMFLVPNWAELSFELNYCNL